jgi:AhpD family alkylhydroperoxidase
VDGKVVAIGAYPSREELIGFIGLSSDVERLFTPLVAELVAIGAAVAANCDSCLRYHIKAAKGMGVSEADITLAIEMAVKVKGVSHRIVMGVAERLTQPEKDEVEPSDAS